MSLDFFLLFIIKNYKQDAFKIQEKIARYKRQKKRYDNLISFYLIQILKFIKLSFYDEWKL